MDPTRTRDIIQQLAARWLGQEGVQSIYDDERGGVEVIVVEVQDGRRPAGLPHEVDGLRVVVERGGPYFAERR